MLKEKTMLWIQVKTGARLNHLKKIGENQWKVELKERPIRQAANKALIRYLASSFGIPQTAISIKLGHTSKKKLVCIERELHAKDSP